MKFETTFWLRNCYFSGTMKIYITKYVKYDSRSVIVVMNNGHKIRLLTSLHGLYILYRLQYTFSVFPQLPWSHFSFSVLPLADQQHIPLPSLQLPPSQPAALAQPVGNFHARLIEFKGSLSPISVRGWDQTRRSCCHTHLKASVCKWTLNNGTHSMEEPWSSRQTNKQRQR